ncbi:uncharacterized protein LOC113796330 [Dermatophagoides pteronyssinus]|uniref:uncharacterized protein LOC113796330 n=1 Tax=Dermatophagoides pteronyssinus TaxID=6956 RepID=UPI003F66E695
MLQLWLIMSLATLINGILIILAIHIDSIQMTSNSKERDQICERLRQNNSTKFSILAVGKTKKRLLLITMDYLVYDVPIGSINSTIDRLYLGSKPVKLDEKYPILYNSHHFQQIMGETVISLIMSDADSDWICLSTRKDTSSNSGCNYDIDHEEALDGWQYFGKDSLVMISTDQPCQYYSLRSEGTLQINLYQCVGSDRIREVQKISPKFDYSAICYDQTQTKITVQRIVQNVAKCRSGIPVIWPVLKGFVSDGKFYLFGQSHIYIFDENVYKQQGQSYPVEKRSYDSFFNCPGIIAPSNVFKSYFNWIIGAIIVLLAILSILIWCILSIRRRRRTRTSLKRVKSGRSKVMSKQNLSKLSSTIVTKRSAKSVASRMKSRFVRKVGSRSALSQGSGNVTVRSGVGSKAVSNMNRKTTVSRLKRSSTRIQSNSSRFI